MSHIIYTNLEFTSCDYDGGFDEFLREISGISGLWFVSGDLGLWNGPRHVWACFGSLGQAVLACAEDMDYIEIAESDKGKVTIKGYHHDGTNTFELRKLRRKHQTASACLRDSTNAHLMRELGWI